jgi:hypothetical protein
VVREEVEHEAGHDRVSVTRSGPWRRRRGSGRGRRTCVPALSRRTRRSCRSHDLRRLGALQHRARQRAGAAPHVDPAQTRRHREPVAEAAATCRLQRPT